MAEPDAIDQITRTRLLTATRAHTTNLVLDQIDSVISRMRSEYRGGQLIGDVAIGYIAELTSLYDMIGLIDSQAKRAIHGEEVTRTGTD